MVKLSDIAKWMIDHPSSIREIMSLVAEFEKHPEKWPRKLIYLAGGWPQDKPPEILREKMREVIERDDLWLRAARYSPTLGFPDIREAVVNYEREIWGRRINVDNIVFGLGSTEQIGAIFLAILNPNDEVILTSPGYLNYERQLQLETKLGVKIKYWRIISEEGIFSPDLDEFQNVLTENTKLVIITIPGNPDGQIWEDAIINSLLDLAEEREFYILFDVAYRAFIFEKDVPKYFSKPVGEYDIWSCTLSKELRTPGWRASYLILPENLVRALDTIEQARTLAPVSLIQMVLASLFNDTKALTSLREFYRKGAQKYARAAKYTVELLEKIPDIKVLEPRGGFYVFFDVSKYDKDSKKIWLELIHQYQVALAPGVDFNGFDGWLRLSFAPVVESPNVLEEGLGRMREYFEKKKSRA